MQSPPEVAGVKIDSFLRQAMNAQKHVQKKDMQRLTIKEHQSTLQKNMKKLNMNQEFAHRYLNSGFSGGEKKKSEILQLAMLQPEIAILDEIDSGLDVDSLKKVCQLLLTIQKESEMGLVLITHYPRILKYLSPNYVHVLADGKIVKSGAADLAHKIEEQGYDWLTQATS